MEKKSNFKPLIFTKDRVRFGLELIFESDTITLEELSKNLSQIIPIAYGEGVESTMHSGVIPNDDGNYHLFIDVDLNKPKQ